MLVAQEVQWRPESFNVIVSRFLFVFLGFRKLNIIDIFNNFCRTHPLKKAVCCFACAKHNLSISKIFHGYMKTRQFCFARYFFNWICTSKHQKSLINNIKSAGVHSHRTRESEGAEIVRGEFNRSVSGFR